MSLCRKRYLGRIETVQFSSAPKWQCGGSRTGESFISRSRGPRSAATQPDKTLIWRKFVAQMWKFSVCLVFSITWRPDMTANTHIHTDLLMTSQGCLMAGDEVEHILI